MPGKPPRRNLLAPTLMDRLLGPRIAQKIFWGYVLPFSFVLAFGIVLPIFLWFYLGRAIHTLDDLNWLSDQTISLRRSAADTEAHAYGFVLYHDPKFEVEFMDARITYRSRYREVEQYIESVDDPELLAAVNEAGNTFETWQNLAIVIPFEMAMHQRPGDIPRAVRDSQLRGIQDQFGPVQSHLDYLVSMIDNKRTHQIDRSQNATLLREFTSVVIPLVALVLSLLFGRLSALGITRPLETLTRATRELEQDTDSVRLLLDDFGDLAPDDEIGDLQRAFRQMARTIGQREAVLHAQNEAVGALNRRIESVLNATNDGILMLDRAGGFSVVNQRLADLFGLEADSLQNQMFDKAGPLLLNRFRNRSAIKRRFQELIEDPEGIADEIHDLSEPASRTVRIYSAPVRGYKDLSGESPAHPISAEASNASEPAQMELLGRIFVFRDVTRETMLDRMKTEFVSTVSHELRTPLTAIKGYIDLMVTGQTGPLNEIQTEFLTLVQSSTRRLTDLINDMLDISRIESGRVELSKESVDYLPVVRETIRMMQPEADTKGITLALELSDAGRGDITDAEWEGSLPPVRGDADRITQVLTNFLSNGIKYTPQGGRVLVRIEFENDFITTCIADTGIGISPDDQRKLFQKFFRADNSTTRQAGGTGLGLAITKAILEKLNGSVWVESERGVGSRFYFTLPCVDGDSGDDEHLVVVADIPIKRLSSADHEGISPLVLPITADLPTLHRLNHELRREGYVTSGATTSAEAIRRARDLRPDIILLDPLTHGLDGRDILRDLRDLPSSDHAPVIVIASLHLQSNNLAAFRDDVAVLPTRAVCCDELPVPILAALRAAERRHVSRTPEGESPRAASVLGIGATLSSHLETALRATGMKFHLTVATSRDQIEAYLQGELAHHAPDAIVVAADADAGFDIGTWIARLRRRRPDDWSACILLVDDAIYDGLDIRVLAPVGAGSLPVERIGTELRANLDRETHRTAAEKGF